MNIGTKSILFGVNQFIIHPIMVVWAWRMLYRQWPRLHEWCAIITHDLGYWGSPDMDGTEGEKHPAYAARWWYRNFGYKFGRKVGHALYDGGPKRKGPLRKIIHHASIGDDMFDSDSGPWFVICNDQPMVALAVNYDHKVHRRW